MKIFLFILSIFFLSYSVVYAQGSSCATSEILCNPNASFPATTGVGSLGSVDCLGSTPNPSYYTINIAQSGTLALLITNSNGIDVDFAIWGPYTNPTGNCAGTFPSGTPADCSFSDSDVENVDIPSVVAGEFYILLITNFNGGTTNISLNPTAGNTAALGGPLAINPVGPFSASDSPVQLTTSPPTSDPSVNVTSWTGPGVNASGVFDPSIGVGNYTITANGTSFGCTASASTTISVTCGNPTIDIVAPATGLCQNDPNFALNVNEVTPGTAAITAYSWTGNTGALSATNVQSPTFSTDTPGTYNLTVSVTTADGCGASDNITITVDEEPVADWSGVTLCDTGDPVDLNNFLATDATTGGTWSGTGVTGTTFDPAVAGQGAFSITYSLPANGNCPAATDDNIINVIQCASCELFTDVTPECDVTAVEGGGVTNFDLSNSILIGDPASIVVEFDLDDDGVFEIDNGNSLIYDHVFGACGEYPVTVQLTDGTCVSTETFCVFVACPPNVTLPADDTICEGETLDLTASFTAATQTCSISEPTPAPIILAGNTATTGLGWSRGCPGSAGSNYPVDFETITVPVTGQYDIFTSTAPADGGGDYDGYLYIYEGVFNPANPAATTCLGEDDDCLANGTRCSEINGITLTAGVTYSIVYSTFASSGLGAGGAVVGTVEFVSGGTTDIDFTPDYTADWSSGSEFLDDPADANTITATPTAEGDNIYTYVVTDTKNDCVFEFPVTVTVNPNPDPSFSPQSTLCETDAAIDLTASVTSDPATVDSRTFSGTGVTGNDFDPAAAGPGTFVITMTEDLAGCIATSQETITVIEAGDASLNQTSVLLCSDDPVFNLTTLYTGTTDATGTWSGAGVTGTNFDPSDPSISPGFTYTLSYTAGTVPCQSTATVTMVISGTTAPEVLCPADIVTSTDAGVCNAFVTIPFAQGNDNCFGTLSFAYDVTGATTANGTNNDASGTYELGTSTVTFTVTDDAAATATCSFSVAINDNENPVITCPADITVSASATTCDANVTVPASIQTDNCTIAVVDNNAFPGSPDASGVYPVGNTVVSFIVIDNSGNSAQCTMNVTVEDNTAPILTCPTPGGSTTADFTGDFDVANWTATINDDGGFDTSLAPNSITATGGNDLFNNATSNTLAIAIANDGVLSFSWNYTSTDVPGFDDFGYSINGVVTPLADTDGQSGTENISVVAGDVFAFVQSTDDNSFGAGVTTIAGFSFTEAGSGGTFPADAGVCTYTIPDASFDPTASDNCGVTSLATDGGLTSLLGESFDVGTNVVSWIAEDAAGNQSVCAITIEVVDEEDPELTCPPNVSVGTDANVCTAFVKPDNPVFNDNCGVASIVNDYTNSSSATSTYPEGPATTVVYTVTDESGNTTTCSFTVTVTDDQVPTIISCGTDIEVSNDAGVCEALVTVPNPTGFFDNCDTDLDVTNDAMTTGIAGATMTDASGTYPVGTTVVVYTVTDDDGNSSTCSINVIVTDDEAPEIVCPADVVVGNDVGVCTADITGLVATATDNCTATPSIVNDFNAGGDTADDTYPAGTTEVTFTATDTAGNDVSCTFTVEVLNSEAPGVVCPADITVDTDPSDCSAFVNVPLPSTDDNCGISDVVNDYTGTPSASDTYLLGTTTVTYTITDVNGNTSTCSFDVTVEDGQAPNILCPPNVTVNNDSGVCEADILINNPFAFDNCDTDLSFSNDYNSTDNASDVYPVGDTVVTFTVEDDNANTSTCAITVKVIDNEAPTVDCDDITQTADAGVCEAAVTVPAPVVGDNCDVAGSINDFNGTDNASDTYPVGTTMVTWTTTDVNGNTAECSFDVIITDDEIPTFDNCPTAPVEFDNDPSLCGAFITPVALTASDNCDIFGILNDYTLSTNPTSFYPVGTTTVTFTASDVNGNTSECVVDVVVNDVDAPSLQCVADAGPIANNTGICGAVVVIDLPLFLDNCSDPTIAFTATDFAGAVVNDVTTGSPIENVDVTGLVTTPPFTYPVGTSQVIFTVTDASGNTSTCINLVEIRDEEMPSITCPADVVVDNDPGLCEAAVTSISAPLVDDNCGVAFFENDYNSTLDANDVYPVGTTVVTWTVTDVNSNTSSCSINVTVNDVEAPAIVCPADIETCNPRVFFSDPVASDNCGATFELSDESGSDFAVGVTTVVATATDDAGNTSTCSFDITYFPMQADFIVSDYNGANISCNGGADGSIEVVMTSGIEPYTYAWSHDAALTDPVATDLSAGFYSVTVTGSGVSGCILVQNFVLTQPTALVCSVSATDIDCEGNENGSITASATGGTMPYSYAWSHDAALTDATATDLAAGTYTVTITDANGCVCTETATITTPDGLTNLSGTFNTDEGDGFIPSLYNVNTIEVSGGDEPYFFDWSTTGLVQYDVTPNDAGDGVLITIVYADAATWSLTVTDSNDCNTQDVTFDNTDAIDGDASSLLDIMDFTITADNGTGSGTITIVPMGGNPSCTSADGYEYSWSGPITYTGIFANSPAQTGLVSGWYTVTVTDCDGQQTVGWYWVPKQTRGRGKLAQANITAYPNPFDAQTNINFSVDVEAQVSIDVFNIEGRLVASVFDGYLIANEEQTVQFNAAELPTGMYVAVLRTEAGELERFKLLVK